MACPREGWRNPPFRPSSCRCQRGNSGTTSLGLKTSYPSAAMNGITRAFFVASSVLRCSIRAGARCANPANLSAMVTDGLSSVGQRADEHEGVNHRPANDPLHPGAYWVVTCKPNFTRFHPWGYTRSPGARAPSPPAVHGLRGPWSIARPRHDRAAPHVGKRGTRGPSGAGSW